MAGCSSSRQWSPVPPGHARSSPYPWARTGAASRIDALVRDVQAGVLGMHAPECAGNLLRRPAPGEHGAHNKPQATLAVQLGQWSRGKPSLMAHALSRRAGVGASTDIAPELTVDGAGAASQQLGHAAHAPALLVQRRQCHSLFRLQVRVGRSHLRTLPGGRVLHFAFETATFLTVKVSRPPQAGRLERRVRPEGQKGAPACRRSVPLDRKVSPHWQRENKKVWYRHKS